jgi:hypothetical protein
MLTFYTQLLFSSRYGNTAGSAARILYQPHKGKITKCQSPRLYEYQQQTAGGFLRNAKAYLSHDAFCISLNLTKFRHTMSYKQVTKSNILLLEELRQFQIPVTPLSPNSF